MNILNATVKGEYSLCLLEEERERISRVVSLFFSNKSNGFVLKYRCYIINTIRVSDRKSHLLHTNVSTRNLMFTVYYLYNPNIS